MFHEVPAMTPAAPLPSTTTQPPLRGSLWRAGVIPVGLAGLFLFLAGGTWDISWHIDIGRDTFFSPPHLLLYAGLLSMAFTPLWALVLGRRLSCVPEDTLAGPTVRLRHVPVSPGIVIGGIGALLSFLSGPVDELWHQVFGLDVTIWSPPHLQLLFGAVLACLGLTAALAGELNRSYPQRLGPQLGGIPRDARWYALVLSFVLLLMMLGGLLGEYSFAIAQHGLQWHPILLPAICLVVLFAAGRSLAIPWAATAIAIGYSLVDTVLQAFLVTMGRTMPVATVLLPTAVLIDLVWTQRGQSLAPRRFALPALGATVVLLGTQFQFLRLDSAMPWPLEQWVWLLPASLLSGTVAAFLGARIGAALRPTPAATGAPAQSVITPGSPTAGLPPAARAGIPAAAGALLVALATSALPTTAAAQNRADATEPRVEYRLTSIPPVAGEPATFELRFSPASAVDLTTARMKFEQGDVSHPIRLETASEPGVLRATVTPPSRGSWSMPLRFLDREGQPWLGWASIQAAAPGQTWRDSIPYVDIKLQPDRTRELTDADSLGMLAGKVFVSLTIVVAVAGGLFALRTVERDARRLAVSLTS